MKVCLMSWILMTREPKWVYFFAKKKGFNPLMSHISDNLYQQNWRKQKIWGNPWIITNYTKGKKSVIYRRDVHAEE